MNRYLNRSYFHRYLAGGPVLRRGRQVSRRDFIIASSGIKTTTAIADEVAAATQRFSTAVSILTNSQQLDLEQLSHINAALRGPLASPVLRDKPLTFKALRAMNNYQCPEPELALAQSKQLLSLHWTKQATAKEALALLAGLTLAHPFTEGNGRTTRALFETLCTRHQHSMLSPYLFVLSSNRMDDFIGFLHSHRDSAYRDIGQRFFHDFLVWQEHFSMQCSTIESDTVNKINNKLLFIQPDRWHTPLLQLFWQSPMISVKTLPAKVADYFAAKPALDTLLKRGIVSMTTFHNELCFVADDILAAHEAIEGKLLAVS
ncbi:Fic family protein [Alkalimonas collagenimarina]|uniref:Fic family protein n=1 Tax=Alkalimonas collagenimarina TaxID=400390 RepID=A0ABT9GVZ7_9GAMM|nr:Fic family protein [Alkalimonas collagenimarina]MDP4535212.1 Fic family protein [Alkalimonas collagenimarina]